MLRLQMVKVNSMNLFPERGQIWLVRLDPSVGAEIKKTRPALIISNNINNQYSLLVTVLPIIDKGENVYPFEVYLSSSTEGLKKESKIKCQQIKSIDKTRLIKHVGKIPLDKIAEVESALMIHLDIEK